MLLIGRSPVEAVLVDNRAEGQLVLRQILGALLQLLIFSVAAGMNLWHRRVRLMKHGGLSNLLLEDVAKLTFWTTLCLLLTHRCSLWLPGREEFFYRSLGPCI